MNWVHFYRLIRITCILHNVRSLFWNEKKRNKGIKWHLEGILFICARAVIFKIINQTVQSSRLGEGRGGGWEGEALSQFCLCVLFEGRRKTVGTWLPTMTGLMRQWQFPSVQHGILCRGWSVTSFDRAGKSSSLRTGQWATSFPGQLWIWFRAVVTNSQKNNIDAAIALYYPVNRYQEVSW